MTGGLYKRGTIWWCWWTQPVKDPKTGMLRSKKCFASSQSTRRPDAVTLLSTKMNEARTQKPRLDVRDPTYEEVRDLWLRHREADLAKKGQKIDRLQNGEIYFQGRKYLDEFFGGWKASAIDTQDIENLQSTLLDRGLHNGINHVVRSLRGMLRYAVKAKRLDMGKLPDEFPLMKVQRRAPESIDEKFVEPLLAALPQMYRVPFTLAYHSGMRLSEIERLCWKHYQRRQERLYFPGAKTGEWRYVPLLGGTAKLLASLPRGKDDELMFPGFSDRSARSYAWRKAAAAVGLGSWHCRKCDAEVFNRECPKHGHLGEKAIKYRGPLFRFTRTTAIRTLTNRGVPTARVMQMMGHKTFSVHMGYNVEEEADLDLIRKRYDCNQNVTDRVYDRDE